MGAWGVESFANDDALDWAAELEEADGHARMRAALEAVTEAEGEYLEAPQCSAALAAAEVVAALRGRPAADLPENVAAWVAAHRGAADEGLADLARRAVESVEARSELRELWEESDDFAAWRADLAALRARLA
jgi:hypothetical protein